MNRRDLMLSAVAAGASLPGVATAGRPVEGQTDPHTAWLSEWLETRDFINNHPSGQGQDFDAVTERNFELDALLSETQATTTDGAAAQIRWLLLEDDWLCEYHRVAAQSVLAALEAMV